MICQNFRPADDMQPINLSHYYCNCASGGLVQLEPMWLADAVGMAAVDVAVHVRVFGGSDR